MKEIKNRAKAAARGLFRYLRRIRSISRQFSSGAVPSVCNWEEWSCRPRGTLLLWSRERAEGLRGPDPGRLRPTSPPWLLKASARRRTGALGEGGGISMADLNVTASRVYFETHVRQPSRTKNPSIVTYTLIELSKQKLLEIKQAEYLHYSICLNSNANCTNFLIGHFFFFFSVQKYLQLGWTVLYSLIIFWH